MSRSLSGSRIEIDTQNGMVTLTGVLATPTLKAEAVARARGVAGVAGSRGPAPGCRPDHSPGPVSAASGSRPWPRPRRYMGETTYASGPGSGVIANGGAAMGGPVAGGGFVNDGGPLPEGPAGGPGGSAGAMPGNPNYAWPSYAPYPNFSAVGYPTAYPWQAWPNIGPFYPYPEVPLDWRAVTLRWDDGIWWLDFKKHYTRPFFVPYPFGIAAY